MVGISAVLYKSRLNSDGTIPIKIKITHVNTTAYILTRYKLESESEWKDGRVVKRADAPQINRRLRDLVEYYEKLADRPPRSAMTAKELKRWMEKEALKTDNLVEYAQRFVDDLKKNNQKSYATNMGYTVRYLEGCFGKDFYMSEMDLRNIKRFERYLYKQGQGDTTVNIRMTHLKALLNSAIIEGETEISGNPFAGYRMPQKVVRDICISKEDLERLRNAKFEGRINKGRRVARDLFMLSFYCAGINMTDLMDAKFTDDVLTFERKKTAGRRRGAEKLVSITIQPEAQEIISRYVKSNGKLSFGYHYKDYEQFRSYMTKVLNKIGKDLGIEKKLMYYSARKTFCQFGFELGVPLYILEYAIGQTIKDANYRPIFNYIKIMRKQADEAIRKIIDYSLAPDCEIEEGRGVV